jgi:hypothetical protein
MNHRQTLLARVGSGLGMAAALLLAACGGGSGDGSGDGGGMNSGGTQLGGSGTLAILLTDQPACGFDHVFVTVERVRVHASSTADESSGGWTDIAVDPARKIDLLELTNGRFEELGVTPLPAADYTQVRLLLSPNPSGGPPANSVVPTNGSEVALATPSAVQSGLKVIHPFTVEEGKRVDLMIDFDACRSIVRRGNGTFGLKPVLNASVKEVTEIVGFVDPAIDDVTVTAQKNGTVVRGTQPDPDGSFRLAWLSAADAPYDVVFTAPNHATAVVHDVPVTQGTTVLSRNTSPISLGTSDSNIASGTVNPLEAQDGAVVHALQEVGSAPDLFTVEVATTNVDDTTGQYSMSLPIATPQVADFSTTLPLVFTPQGAAGLYTLEASAAGFATQAAQVDLNSGDVTQDFTLLQLP